MKDLISRITNAGGDQWLGFLAIATLAGLVTLILIAIASDHSVRCYYPKMQMEGFVAVYRVMGDVNWADDITAFASHDHAVVLSALSELKQCEK